jgi:hypothetical protein
METKTKRLIAISYVYIFATAVAAFILILPWFAHWQVGLAVDIFVALFAALVFCCAYADATR